MVGLKIDFCFLMRWYVTARIDLSLVGSFCFLMRWYVTARIDLSLVGLYSPVGFKYGVFATAFSVRAVFNWVLKRIGWSEPQVDTDMHSHSAVDMVLHAFFPQQRKLGVFSHSKGSGAGRSSQIRWEPGSGEGSGEEFPFTGESLGAARSARRKVGNRVPSKRFPSKVPRNRFPSNVPSNQEEVPSKVPNKGSPSKVASKVPRNRFRKGS